jgi:hypothetical protein
MELNNRTEKFIERRMEVYKIWQLRLERLIVTQVGERRAINNPSEQLNPEKKTVPVPK